MAFLFPFDGLNFLFNASISLSFTQASLHDSFLILHAFTARSML